MESFGLLRIRFLNLVLLFAALAIAGCSITQTVLPTKEPDVVVEEATTETAEQEQDVIAYGLDEGDDIVVIDDPHELLAQAENANLDQVPALLIRATRLFIDQGQIGSARSTLDQLGTYSLTPDERFSQQVLRAQLASLSGQHQQAISLLSVVNIEQVIDIEQKKSILSALANSQAALGRFSDSVNSMLMLDKITEGNEKVKNQRNILALLEVMDPLHVSLLREQSRDPAINGWLALSEILTTSTEAYRDLDIQNWKRLYPDHPATAAVLGEESSPIDLAEYSQIAIMLPLTSPFGAAAKAFYDGFMDAHNASTAFRLPQVLLYDIGEEAFLTSFYYQAAMTDGADFVVGPLGRTAVDTLLSENQTTVNTFVIADIPEGRFAENLFGISLSPELEAIQAAEKAFESGHRSVSILRSETDWGTRVANAFAVHWESLGGNIVKNSFFPRDVPDYTRVLQKFLGLDESITRHRLLEAQVGSSLEFTPRRSDEMDFLFLAANAEHARLVVPQLRFFQAHDLPIFATSYVYSGEPNPATDADLDGLIFGDMEWVLAGVQAYKLKIAEEAARKAEEEAARLLQEQEQSEAENSGESDASESDIVEDQLAEESDEVADDSIADVPLEDDLEVAGEDGLPLDQPQDTSARSQYEFSDLGRLYALGYETYNIIPRAESMRGNELQQYSGENLTITITADGKVVRHPVWVTFKSGLLEPANLQ